MSVETDELRTFEAQRPRLFAIAYRMLGSASEAEDAVQDTYLRWDSADRSGVREPAAWLTRVLTNLCLTRLTSARARRESYVGPWLPEPVITGDVGDAGLGPLDTVEQRDSVSMAFLLALGSGQCVSLGRRDGLIQHVDADDRPLGTVLTGRAAALVKEWVVRGALWTTQHPGPHLRR